MDGKLITDTVVGRRRVRIFKDIKNIDCDDDTISFDCEEGPVIIHLDTFNKFELHRRAL